MKHNQSAGRDPRNHGSIPDAPCSEITFTAAETAALMEDEAARPATARPETSFTKPTDGRRQNAADGFRVILLGAAVLLCVLMAGYALVAASSGPGRELSVVRGAGERFQEFAGVAHDLAFLFSAAGAIPVILAELVAIRAFTRSTAQILRGLAMAVVPMAGVAIIKLLVARPRPDTPNGALMADPSFPSGHTACAVVIASLALFVLKSFIEYVVARRPQAASSVAFRILCAILCAVAFVTPPVVALSRVVYGAHYPTDVFASLVLAPTLVWCMYRLCDQHRP